MCIVPVAFVQSLQLVDKFHPNFGQTSISRNFNKKQKCELSTFLFTAVGWIIFQCLIEVNWQLVSLNHCRKRIKKKDKWHFCLLCVLNCLLITQHRSEISVASVKPWVIFKSHTGTLCMTAFIHEVFFHCIVLHFIFINISTFASHFILYPE